jgi:ABC-2 type transport system permease protein
LGATIAIARKELKSYFSTPIAYTVIGLFALVFGSFFVRFVDAFVRQSLQIGIPGNGQINIQTMVIRPVLGNVSVVLLFVLPLLTMRSYAEEKRFGTVELLLTSPLTDYQIIVGKFLGAAAIYCLMLAVTVPHIALLFIVGNPEWRPIVAGYAGLLLLGVSFIPIGLLISSLTRNQIVAAMATLSVLLLFWTVSWFARDASPIVQGIILTVSLTEHFDDFTLGIIRLRHVVYYLSLTVFGLFLTGASLDSERWRG